MISLPETPVNNINNPILLLGRHLVIAWQTESSAEKVGSNVDSGAFYVSVGATSAVTFDRNEGV
jgi:hypothetical protein